LLGQAAIATGRPARARRAWETYLRLAPDAADRDVVRAWLARLDAMGVTRVE